MYRFAQIGCSTGTSKFRAKYLKKLLTRGPSQLQRTRPFLRRENSILFLTLTQFPDPSLSVIYVGNGVAMCRVYHGDSLREDERLARDS